MQNPKISVIVTVHNAKKTLEESIRSVIGQTFTDIEIVCIDGGSTDGSGRLLSQLSRLDSRIVIINDPNTSYGHKINKGIEYANGEYISILESDDSYKDDMLERLYDVASRYDCDYVDGDYESFFYINERKCTIPVKKYIPDNMRGRKLDQEENIQLLGNVPGAIWTGLYRTSFIRDNNISLSETPGAAFQDTSFAFLVSMLARSAYHISRVVYSYWKSNSESSTNDQNKIMAIAHEYEYLFGELQERKVSQYVWDRYYRCKYRAFIWNVYRLNERSVEGFLEYYVNELKKDSSEKKINRSTIGDDYLCTYELLDDRDQFIESAVEHQRRGVDDLKIICGLLSEVIGRNTVIFGCGPKGGALLKILSYADVEISCLCDNDEELQNMISNNIVVRSPQEAVQMYPDDIFIIPRWKHRSEMKEQLLELGLDERNIVELSFDY